MRWLGLFIVGAALAAASCSAASNIGGVGGVAGTGGVAGMAGTGGVAGMAGTAGAGGVAGTGGVGGVAGTGGVGGVAGTGGVGGTAGTAGVGGTAGTGGVGGVAGAGGVGGVAGTGGTAGTAGAGGVGGTAGTVARPSAGCGLPGSSGVSSVLTTNIRGTEREYITQVPTPYVPTTPLPLVFNPHEQDGTINSAGGWDLGVPNEAVFVWPQGLDYVDDGGTSWNLTCGGEDIEFFETILTEIANTRCIDLSRVFSFGYSYGAQMSVALACCWDSTTLRAIAPVSGNWEDYWAEEPECDGIGDPGFPDPPSMRLSYGTHDHIFPESTFDSLSARYRSDLGCSADYDITPVSDCSGTWSDGRPTVTCECKTYRGCSLPYTDCKFTNMGHDIPDNYEIDTWTYFSSFASTGAER